MKNENKFIKDTGTTVVVGRINFLHTLIHGKSLQYFNNLAIQNNGMDNDHPKEIHEGLLE